MLAMLTAVNTTLPTVSAMTTQSRSLRKADWIASHPHTSVGAYPQYAVTSDGAALCPSCCKSERESIGTTTGSDGWNVIAIDVNYESLIYCDHCSTQIETAYGVAK